MSNLEIDPATTALVLIDLQNGIVARPVAPHTAANVVQRSAVLAEGMRRRGGTVVYVHVLIAETQSPIADRPRPRLMTPLPPEASELVPEAGFQPGDVVVAKRQWGAFYGTDLDLQLRRRRIRTLIMTGIATNIGVESTARDAQERGYELIFAEDAMSSLSTEMHRFAIENIFPVMGRVRNSEEILNALSTANS
jgi:nicotinamidase-related amidase